jgi:hypothetical protein
MIDYSYNMFMGVSYMYLIWWAIATQNRHGCESREIFVSLIYLCSTGMKHDGQEATIIVELESYIAYPRIELESYIACRQQGL